MKTKLFYLLGIAVLACSCNNPVKVACIGDSITNGGGRNHLTAFYPVQLGQILGEKYQVLNCGESGSTMLKESNKSYWSQKDLPNVFVFQPDVIVIMLGTNDSKTLNWNADNYRKDYQALIDTLKTMKSDPGIFLCTPPPAYSSAWTINDTVITEEIIPIVKSLAAENNLGFIDVYEGMSGVSELFPDGIHPDAEGKKLMAGIVAGKLLEK